MSNKTLENFFQDNAYDFEIRYDKPSWIDRMFRKSIFWRLDEVLLECQKLKCKTVLDIGCGYGFQARRLGESGIDVLGIDFSENMIKDAIRMSKGICGNARVEFICKDFLEFISEKKFDAVIALGVFDYIKEPQEFLKKMVSLALKCAIISFPAQESPLMFQRKIRYKLFKKISLHFYSKPAIEQLMKDCSIVDYDLQRIDRDYILKIHVC
jgi:2-polyprenyl-3-methyl-5-hydroxy-6-metoxy-1,4-benzoquinol methylase